jgi:glycosyltransferase involved in cell wall biosynthesis
VKIVFLAPFGIRPKGTLLARMLPLAVELQKLGHKVVVVAPPYTNPEDSGRVETVRGVQIVNVRLPKGGKILGVLPLVWRMFRATAAEKPELVHLFKPKGYGGLAAMLLLALRKIGFRLPPVFVDSDDWEGRGGMNELLDYSPPERWLYELQEKWLLRHASGVTVASRELERITENLGVHEHILYIPNCVEPSPATDGTSIRRRFGIADDVKIVLLYTRFFEFSQERLHRVFSGIHQHLPDVRFLVVGKGRNGEEDSLCRAARRMGFADALVMAGWVEPCKLPDYLAAADVAIYPLDDNLLNRAKCPAKLTEILNAAVPVVADAVGQAKEYIKDGKSGILSDPADWAGMVKAVVNLLSSSDLRNQLGHGGRQRLLDVFTWPSHVAELDFFYSGRCR